VQYYLSATTNDVGLRCINAKANGHHSVDGTEKMKYNAAELYGIFNMAIVRFL